jgi:hypothetical protein
MRFLAGLALCAVVAIPTAAAGTRSRLEPAPAVVKGACSWIAQAAKRQGSSWRTVCPPKVPRSFSTSVRYVGGVSSLTDLGSGYLIRGVSPDASSRSLHNGEWTFASGDPAAVGAVLLAPTDVNGRSYARYRSTTMVLAGTRVTVYRMAPGTATLSGYVVVLWTSHGQAYQVGVARWRSDRQSFALATGMAAATIRSLRR